jgi:hypothetical protein
VLSGRGPCDGPITCPEESYLFDCLFGEWNVQDENRNYYLGLTDKVDVGNLIINGNL